MKPVIRRTILVLGFAFIFTACGAPSQTTPVMTAAFTAAQSVTLSQLAAPNQTATPEPTATMEPAETSELPATPLPDIDLNIELPPGDPKSGRDLSILWECHGCHNPLYPSRGPQFQPAGDLPGLLERGEVRLASADYKGSATNNLEYFIESVYLPEAYIVPGEWKRGMPTNFLERITVQELADLLAWVATFE